MSHKNTAINPGLFSLQGYNVLLTGASGHLGQAIAKGLCVAGAQVLLHGRNKQRLQALQSHLIADGHSADILVFDLLDEQQIQQAFIPLQGKPLHGIIHNAYSGDAGTIETARADQYQHSYITSVVSAHNIITASLTSLQQAVSQQGSASVINIASMYGLVSPDLRIYDNASTANPPFYGAAKAALIQWTRYAACEFGHEGIRFNSISPGPFPGQSVQKSKPALISKLVEKVPLRRIGQPSEIAGPVVFLASTASSYINGCNLCVDGGWTAW